MSKSTFYFSHDYNARNDPKLQKLLMKHGQEGKGIYWDLIEMLYEQDGYLLLSECETYAFQLRTQYERITDVIRGFDLFNTDENRFWSESVLKRLETRKNRSEKARESVNVRWNDTKVIRTKYDSNTNKGKESKIKERKEVSKYKIIPPTLEDIKIRMEERNITSFSAETFFSNYERIGWMVGKNKMKDWDSCLTYWNTNKNRNNGFNRQPSGKNDKRANDAWK